jgi:hypothetical protein
MYFLHLTFGTKVCNAFKNVNGLMAFVGQNDMEFIPFKQMQKMLLPVF